MTRERSFWVRTNFCTGLILVFEKITLLTLLLDITLIKLLPDSRKGLLTGMIFDSQKVFYTVDHQILQTKMKCLGFSKNTIIWLKSYLYERKFKISINTSTPVLLNYCEVFFNDLMRCFKWSTLVSTLHKWLAPSYCQWLVTLCW